MELQIGQSIYIQSFKHDGSLHRTWAKGIVVDVLKNVWIIVTYKTMVVESNHRIWQTREPAICFFYPDQWYNIIAMMRKNGVTYYCNVASPSVYDGESLKNVDYDLDLKVYPNDEMEILDEDEFDEHRVKMNYSKDIVDIARNALQELIVMAENKTGPFDLKLVETYFKLYLMMGRKKAE